MIVVKGGSFSFCFYGVNEVRESSIHPSILPSFPHSIHPGNLMKSDGRLGNISFVGLAYQGN
jgi:hypothetical protein